MKKLDRPHHLIIATFAILAAAIVLAITFPIIKAKTRRANDILTLMGAVQSFKQCIIDPTAWNATINNPNNYESLRCVFSAEGCESGKPIPVERLLSMGLGGREQLCVPGYDLSNAQQGLTADGIPCDSFGGRGSDQCPYRVEFQWIPYCAGGEKSCKNPAEEVVFTLEYKPGSRLSGTAPVFSDGFERRRFQGRQTIGMWRNEELAGSSITILESLPSGLPAGPCADQASKPTRRNMNVIQSDTRGRAATDNDGSFWLKRGEYDCSLSTPGFKIGTFRSVLIDADTGQELLVTANGYSSSTYGTAQARTDGAARISLAKAKNHLKVLQYCTEEPNGSPEQKYLALGVPVGIGPEVYAVLDCKIVPGENI